MMGGRAFILLKAGRRAAETVKQAEIRLASLLKILHNTRSGGESPLARRDKDPRRLCRGDFRSVWLIRRNRPLCYLDHSIGAEIGAVSCKEMQVKVEQVHLLDFYTRIYTKGSDETCQWPRYTWVVVIYYLDF
jgi:hypothetical protein